MITKKESSIRTIDILKHYHRITGARISLHDIDFNEIASYPATVSAFCAEVQKNPNAKRRCLRSDAVALNQARKSGEAYIYKCHCGLMECVVPVYNYGTLAGYFMLGQITDDSSESLEKIKNLSREYFVERKSDLDVFCSKIHTIKSNMLDSIITIGTVLAEYMTETERMEINNRDIPTEVLIYLNRNYHEKITSKQLCDLFGCSRTTLMNAFKARYGETVFNCLNGIRIDVAEKMLLKTDKSIKLIAYECGFGDQNYFTKVFIKRHNITPSEFRKGGLNI